MKYIIVLVLSFIICSCDVYCPYCGAYECHSCHHYKSNDNGDIFTANKLIGTWQVEYGCFIGSFEIKEIKFVDNSYCEMILEDINTLEYNVYPFKYAYDWKYINFSNGKGMNISFKIDGYLFPELYVRDSFGKYVWKKVKI